MSSITFQKSKAPVVERELDEADHLLAGLCPQRTVFLDRDSHLSFALSCRSE